MSAFDVALIMPLAAGRAADLLDALAGHIELEDDNLLRITVGEHSARFYYRKVASEAGVDAVALPGYPSSGTGQKWNIWVLLPDSPMPPSHVKALRDRLHDWADAQQPTAQGEYHLLGPFTPARFAALAPAAVVDVVRDAWTVIWKGSCPGADDAMAQDDADLID